MGLKDVLSVYKISMTLSGANIGLPTFQIMDIVGTSWNLRWYPIPKKRIFRTSQCEVMTPIVSFGILVVGFGAGSAMILIGAYINETPRINHLILKHRGV
jgi:hypothetical protein